MFKIIERLIPPGKDRPGPLEGFDGVTIHDTDNLGRGAGAKAHANLETLNPDFIENFVSYHYILDDIECYRLLPENERGYHAGDGKGRGNRSTIGIEICVNPDSDLLVATNRAAQLTADILLRHGKTKQDIDNYVFQHNLWSGKDCPRQLREGKPFNWASFLLRVEYYMVIANNNIGNSKKKKKKK